MQKHIIDICGMIKNSKEHINKQILNKFIDEYSLRNEWEIVEKQHR